MNITLSYQYENQSHTINYESTDEIIIGRKGRYPVDVDLSSDVRVNSLHARLFYDMGSWWLADMGSRAGTIVDGQRIARPIALKTGSEFCVGETNIRVGFKDEAFFNELPPGVIETHLKIDDLAALQHRSLPQFSEAAATLTGEVLVNRFIELLRSAFPMAERVAIVLRHDKELIPVAFYPRAKAPVSFTLVRRALRRREAFMWDAETSAESTRAVSSMSGVVVAMVAPLIYRRRVIGAVHVDSSDVMTDWEEPEVKLLAQIADIVGNAIIGKEREILRDSPQVFISYAHDDSADFVEQLANDLRCYQIRVWYDKRLHLGDDWREQLKAAINKAQVCMMVLSPASLNSDWVEWEIDYARQKGKPVFLILAQQCELPEDIKLIQYIDMQTDYQAGIEELVFEIYDVTG